ncbi:hypothetical protein D3C71_1372150 [compost metagenome]
MTLCRFLAFRVDDIDIAALCGHAHHQSTAQTAATADDRPSQRTAAGVGWVAI